MENFTPLTSLIGGAMIGTSASLLLLASGRIAGISGIVGGLFGGSRAEIAWRLWFVGGMLAGGAAIEVVSPQSLAMEITRSPQALVVAGLLVGFGTRLGNGCTSGHGICGISRLSTRSLLATGTFMIVAAATVFTVNHLFGGTL